MPREEKCDRRRRRWSLRWVGLRYVPCEAPKLEVRLEVWLWSVGQVVLPRRLAVAHAPLLQ